MASSQPRQTDSWFVSIADNRLRRAAVQRQLSTATGTKSETTAAIFLRRSEIYPREKKTQSGVGLQTFGRDVSLPVSVSRENKAKITQWRRQNFSAAGAQPGHQNLDWGTFGKLCVPSLFVVQASYTERTIGSTQLIGKTLFCEKIWQSTIAENHVRKTLCNKNRKFGQWLCRKPSAGPIWAEYVYYIPK